MSSKSVAVFFQRMSEECVGLSLGTCLILVFPPVWCGSTYIEICH